MTDFERLGEAVLTVRWDRDLDVWVVHGIAFKVEGDDDPEGGFPAPRDMTLPEVLERAAAMLRTLKPWSPR